MSHSCAGSLSVGDLLVTSTAEKLIDDLPPLALIVSVVPTGKFLPLSQTASTLEIMEGVVGISKMVLMIDVGGSLKVGGGASIAVDKHSRSFDDRISPTIWSARAFRTPRPLSPQSLRFCRTLVVNGGFAKFG